MDAGSPFRFKIATEPWEFAQIHRLNYKTFVEEIPQHAANRLRTRVDKFHHENTYVICLLGDRVVGMVAVRSGRPFSLDEKLEDLDSYLPPGRSVCELRLLSIERDYRRGVLFHGLLRESVLHCTAQGYDLVVISGALGQQKLYERLGFVPFGPVVGSPSARYQPMFVTSERFLEKAGKFLPDLTGDSPAPNPVNLLPGPVEIRPEVRKAFQEAPISHRSDIFMRDFHQTKRLLCEPLGSGRVEIFSGSGTLANDVIAGQLSLIPGRGGRGGQGLILSNGEFGERLIRHATRFRLPFSTFRLEWGDTFDRHRLRRLLDRGSNIRWLWAVHCETSTGVLNDIEALKAICAERDIRLCMDCISSIGTVPIDLDGVYLASGVSGKGIGAFPGLSLVFYHHKVLPAPSALPGCLDLGLYRERDGVPFTISSNLLYALRSAVKRLHQKRPFDDLAALSIRLRSGLLEVGFRIVAPEAHASPAVVTIPLPESISSEEVGRRLEERGYLLHYKSGYLVERNWIQICPMGKFPKEALCSLLKSLREGANPENFRDVTQPWRPPENFLADFVSDYSRINSPGLSADRGKDPIQ